jgi:hypothetical protein
MEEIMKSFMKMLEDTMVAVAFAEEGISVASLRPEADIHSDMGEQIWDLR